MTPTEYVWSVNGIRRHLPPSQKAAVAVALLPALKAGITVERPIALGVLKIKAKLGELLAAPSAKESGSKGGRSKKGDGQPDTL